MSRTEFEEWYRESVELVQHKLADRQGKLTDLEWRQLEQEVRDALPQPKGKP